MKPSTQKITNAVYNDVSRFTAESRMQSLLKLFFSGLYDAKAISPKAITIGGESSLT